MRTALKKIVRLIRVFLVVQWLRIHFAVQGTLVQSLVQEDPACCRATKPVCHDYRAHVLQLLQSVHDIEKPFYGAAQSVYILQTTWSAVLIPVHVEVKTTPVRRSEHATVYLGRN